MIYYLSSDLEVLPSPQGDIDEMEEKKALQKGLLEDTLRFSLYHAKSIPSKTAYIAIPSAEVSGEWYLYRIVGWQRQQDYEAVPALYFDLSGKVLGDVNLENAPLKDKVVEFLQTGGWDCLTREVDDHAIFSGDLSKKTLKDAIDEMLSASRAELLSTVIIKDGKVTQKKAYLIPKIGQPLSKIFIEGVNASKISMNADYKDVYTGVLGYGKDDLRTGLLQDEELTAFYGSYNPKTKAKEPRAFVFEDKDESDPDQLRRKAYGALLDKAIFQLGLSLEIYQTGEVKVGLGDEVRVKYDALSVDIEQRVTSVTRDPRYPLLTSKIEVGNPKPNKLQSLFKKQMETNRQLANASSKGRGFDAGSSLSSALDDIKKDVEVLKNPLITREGMMKELNYFATTVMPLHTYGVIKDGGDISNHWWEVLGYNIIIPKEAQYYDKGTGDPKEYYSLKNAKPEDFAVYGWSGQRMVDIKVERVQTIEYGVGPFQDFELVTLRIQKYKKGVGELKDNSMIEVKRNDGRGVFFCTYVLHEGPILPSINRGTISPDHVVGWYKGGQGFRF